MNYRAYWKLNGWPFRGRFSPSSQSYGNYHSPSVNEALARIQFLNEHGYRLGLILGRPGVGKTQVLAEAEQLLLRANTKNSVIVRKLSLLGLQQGEFFEQLNAINGNRSIGLADSRRASEWSQFRDWLVASTLQGSKVILLLDDADLAHSDVGADLLRALQLETQTAMLIAATEVPIGAMEQLISSHCELRMDILPWDLEHCQEFIHQSLSVCGGRESIYSDQAVVRLHELTEGIARQFVQLADICLVAGAMQGLTQITPDVVDQAAEQISIPDRDIAASYF